VQNRSSVFQFDIYILWLLICDMSFQNDIKVIFVHLCIFKAILSTVYTLIENEFMRLSFDVSMTYVLFQRTRRRQCKMWIQILGCSKLNVRCLKFCTCSVELHFNTILHEIFDWFVN